MVKNKALPDSARLCTPRLVTLCLSFSLPHRLGPIKANLTCLLSLSLSLSLSLARSPTPFILRVSPGSCRGWTPADCYIQVRLAQFSSGAQPCPTLCDPMDCSTPSLPVHHHLLEFTQPHVHWVGDAIQPSHPLSSPFPPTFYLSQH